MPRTTIPEHLIHRLTEVDRNAQLFDQLCTLTEEVSVPIIREAVLRETAATGADVLVNEVKLALEVLAEHAPVDGFNEKHVVEIVRKGLVTTIQPPNDEEFREVARDLAQMMTSAWLESLRSELAERERVALSDIMLPVVSPSFRTWVAEAVGMGRPRSAPIQLLRDALVRFPINQAEIEKIMSTLRLKLFPEPLRVSLPFDLVLVGAPDLGVVAEKRSTYQKTVEKTRSQPQSSRLVRNTEPASVFHGSGAVAFGALSEPVPRSLVKQVRHDSLRERR